MPLSPRIPTVDDEEEMAPPPPPKPRIGTTGGEIPEQQSEIDARQPVQWEEDPGKRQAQIQDEIAKRRAQNFQQEHPFSPSSFQPKPPTVPSHEERQFAADAENQFQYQQQQKRMQLLDQKRAQVEKQKNLNDQLEAQYRGTGQQFYTDAHGRIQPVIEQATGKPLFHRTGWQPATHPETGEPVLMMRDQYGQRQFKSPPVVQSLDPIDDQMYFKMPDGTTVAAGNIDKYIQSPNYAIAKMALNARTRQVKAIHQQALAPMKLLADQSVSALEDARVQIQGIDQQIADLTAKQSNALAADGTPTPLSDGYGATIGQLQSQRDELDQKVKPKGELAQRAARAKAGYTIAVAEAMRDAHLAQQAEIAARVKSQGGKLENDPTYQANLKGLNDAMSIIEQGNADVAKQNLQSSAPAAQQAEQPVGDLEQSEPFAAFQKGVRKIGGVGIQEFARRYGDGRGPVEPGSIVKLSARSKEIDQTLGNSATVLSPKVRDSMAKEKDYIDALTKQRFARLSPEDQQKVAEITRDSTLLDIAKGGAKSTAEGAAKGGGGVLKGIGNLMEQIGPMPGGFEWGGPRSPEQVKMLSDFQEMRAKETPSERMERIKKNPVYQLGSFIQDAAKDAYAKNPHEDEGLVSKAINAASEAAGGFAPLVASGPGAPVTAGLQATGDQMEELYNEQLKKGASKDDAAKFAVNRALASGAIQAALFEILPKPLQKAGNKLIVDKIAGDGLMKFLANRVAQAGEGAVVGGTSKGAENLVADRPIGEGVPAAAAGMAAMQAAMPRGGSKPTGGTKGGEPAPKSPAPTSLPPEHTAMLDRVAAAAEKAAHGTAEERAAANAELEAMLQEKTLMGAAKRGAANEIKSAEKSAQVFEPALKERENTPPPSKSAKESMATFAEDQNTTEATGKLNAQQESKAQKLVDDIQEATGKSREEILASRKGREAGDWIKELESEAKYQKSPLTVDPERRATELRGDLKKLDAEWQAHLDQTAARRKSNEHTDAIRAGDEAKRQDIQQRRAAIEQQLTEADRLRQSAKGGEALKQDLARQERGEPPPEEPGPAPAEKLTEPPSPAGGAKSDYDRYQEIQKEWRAQFEKGNMDPGSPELSALWKENEAIKNRHGGMPPEAPVASTKSGKQMVSDIMTKNPNADPAATKMLVGKKNYEVRDIPISEIGEVFGSKTVQSEVVKKYEATKSSEPIVLNRVEGEANGKLRAIDGKHRLTAAKNRGDKTIKAYVPVDEAIGKTQPEGKSNATEKGQQPTNRELQHPGAPSGSPVRENGSEVREGQGAEAGGGNRPVGSAEVQAEAKSASAVPEAQGQRRGLRLNEIAAEQEKKSAARTAAAEAARQSVKSKVEKIAAGLPDISEAGKSSSEARKAVAEKAAAIKPGSINPEKAPAPVSEHITETSHADVQGDKLNKNWTAFDKSSGTLGIPREEMPQIKSEHRGALVNFLRARDIPAKATMVSPSQLKPTQAEFSPEKVQKAREFSGSERPILISEDNHVVDGHHQWMAGLQDDPNTPMPAIRLKAPIDRVLAEIKEFPSTENKPGVAVAAKAAAKQPSVVGPATPRLSDRAIAALQKAKIETKGKLFDVTGATAAHAWNSAIDLAILAIRAGRGAADVLKLAIDRYKAKHPEHTAEDIAKLEEAVKTATSAAEAAREKRRDVPQVEKSRVPESLREVGVPAKDIAYETRSQIERMSEARETISREGDAKAEEMIRDRSLPADTRVALGGVLLEKKMEALKNAKPDEVPALTRDIQRLTEATRSGVSTESGQGVAMHNKIYQNLAVGSAMEYTKSATRKREQKMGGDEMGKAAQEAAEIFNKTKDKSERDAAIDKLKDKYTTKPVRQALDQLKRIEVAKELNDLGVLTRDDMVNVAGNALGIPGIDQAKLKHIADLADRVNKAENHAQRSRAELELADTLDIYKGVNPLDLEASILTLNILSGPTTQAANLEGNALNLITQLSSTAAVNPTKLGPIMRGLKEGIPLGWDQAKSILMTGRGTRDFQDRTLGAGNALANIDYARDFQKTGEIGGGLLTARARLVEKISRFMKAADAVFYYPAREAYARLVATKLLEGQYSGAELKQKVSEALHTTPEAFQAARQQALKEGYTGVDLGRRVADIIEANRSGNEAGKQAAKEAERFGAEATFNNEPVGIAGVAYRLLSRAVKDADVAGVPVLKPWAMFLRVPANVFNATTNFTPFGATRAYFGMKGENYRKGGSGEGHWRDFTKDERNRLYLQSAVGTGLMAGLTTMALTKDNVNITASGPNDAAKRDQLKAAGWNPYSIKVGNKWVSYRDSPLLVPLAIVGHVVDSIRYQKAPSDLVMQNRIIDAASHAPGIIFQTSMLSSLGDLMESLSGKGDVSGQVSRTLGSIPANLLIPYNRLLQQVDQTMDPKTYKGNVVTDAVPFLRREGTPQFDVQGRNKTYSPSTRFAVSEKNDPVDNVLREKNVFIPEAGKDAKIGNAVMTTEQHDAWRKLSGQRIRARLQAIIPQLRLMTKEQAQKRVEQITREERDRVKPLVPAASKR